MGGFCTGGFCPGGDFVWGVLFRGDFVLEPLCVHQITANVMKVQTIRILFPAFLLSILTLHLSFYLIFDILGWQLAPEGFLFESGH